MADNSQPIAGGDIYSTDQITTLNGVTVTTGEKAQRVKAGFGVDGTFQDVTPATPLPIVDLPNTSVTGTLTASDAVVGAPVGDGTIVSGASTAGSVVYAIIPDGFSAWTLKVTGYTSGTIYTEASNNTTNGTDGDWVEIKARRTGTAVGIESITYAMTANGYYRGNAAGFKAIRARLIGGTGVTIHFMLSSGLGATFLNSGIPSGNSLIGKVGIDQTTPGTTNGVSVTNASLAVTGTFFQTTQPVSLTGNTSVKGGALPSTSASFTTTGTVGPLAVADAGNCTFVVKNTTANLVFTGSPTIVFEQSDDNVSWGPLTVVRSDTNAAATTHTVIAGTSNGSLMFDAPLEGVAYVRARVTSAPASNAMTIVILAGTLPFTPVTAVTGTFWQATQPVSIAATISVNKAQIAGTNTATGNGVSSGGTQRVNIASDNTPFSVNTFLQTPTPFALSSAATTNATSVKAAPGTLYTVTASNVGAAAAFLKLYNTAGTPVPSTSVPVLTVPIPATGVVSLSIGSLGHRFSTGIAILVTNLIADTDATAVAAGQVKVMLDYV